MKDGFEYDNKIWYPTYHRDAVIICVKDNKVKKTCISYFIAR
jgi:hypothetical protein